MPSNVTKEILIKIVFLHLTNNRLSDREPVEIMLIFIEKLIPSKQLSNLLTFLLYGNDADYKMFNSNTSVDIISLYVSKSICLNRNEKRVFY